MKYILFTGFHWTRLFENLVFNLIKLKMVLGFWDIKRLEVSKNMKN